MRVVTLPMPHENGGADRQRERAERDRGGAAGGDDPDADQRQRAARELRGLRALAEEEHGQADRERGLQLQHEARQAGGHALVDADEQQAELARGEEDADADDVLDRDAGAGDEGERERDQAEAQRGEEQGREGVQPDVDDDEVDAPDDGDQGGDEDVSAGHGPVR